MSSQRSSGSEQGQERSEPSRRGARAWWSRQGWPKTRATPRARLRLSAPAAGARPPLRASGATRGPDDTASRTVHTAGLRRSCPGHRGPGALGRLPAATRRHDASTSRVASPARRGLPGPTGRAWSGRSPRRRACAYSPEPRSRASCPSCSPGGSCVLGLVLWCRAPTGAAPTTRRSLSAPSGRGVAVRLPRSGPTRRTAQCSMASMLRMVFPL